MCLKIINFLRPLSTVGLELGAGGSGGKAEGEKTGIEGWCTERCSRHLRSGIEGTEQAGNHRFGRWTKRGGCSCQTVNQGMWLKL